MDDLLVRVDAQVSQFNAEFGSATRTTLQLEAALKKASAQQELLEKQVTRYGRESAQAQATLARAQAANARLAEQQAAVQARAAAANVAALERQRRAYRELGTIAGGFGLAAAIGFGLAAKGASDFDSAMSRVAATGEDARGNLDALRQAAIDAGARTVFSAGESADAITELIKAGVSAKDVLGGGLQGALDLAAAGELDVATAANIAATAMTQFGKSGADVPHIADLLAAAAGKAQGEVGDMAEALKYVGPVAAQMGVSIEETVGTVAELASQGVLASQAGTSLRGILTALTSPSKAAADEMSRLGISVYDAKGNFVGFDGIAGQLQATMGNLDAKTRDAALGTIFGNNQITAARILYAGGAADVAKWTDAVNDQGYAADTAATKLDNLTGDLEKLGGALQTALIETGDSSQGPLRETVQTLAALVDAYNALPDPVKSGTLAVVALTAAVGLGTFAVTRAIAAYGGFKTNLATVSGSFRGAGDAALNYTDRLLGVYDAQTRATMTAQGLAASTSTARGQLVKGVAVAAGFALATSGMAEKSGLANTASLALMGTIAGPWGAALGGGVGLLIDLASANKDLADAMDAANRVAQDAPLDFSAREKALAELQAQADKTAQAFADTNGDLGSTLLNNFKVGADFLTGRDDFQDFAEASQEATDAVASFRAETIQLQQALIYLNEAAGGGANESIDGFRVAADRIVPALQKAGYSLADIQALLLDPSGWDTAIAAASQYARAQDSVQGRTRGVVAAVAGMDDEMLTAADSAEKLSKALDALIGPELDLSAATDAFTTGLRHLVDDLAKHSRELAGNTDGAIKNRAAIRDRVTELTDQLAAEAKAGASARELSRSLAEQRERLIDAGAAAGLSKQDLNEYLDVLGLTPKLVKTVIEANTDTAAQRVRDFRTLLDQLHDKTIAINVVRHGQVEPAIATGGYITGPGTGTSDSIPARLSNGEFVIRAAAVRRIGVGHLHMMNAMGYADGGAVGRPGGGGSGRLTVSELLRLIARPDDVTTLALVNRLRADEERQMRLLVEAQRNLSAVRRSGTATDKELEQAEKAVSKARDEEREATDKWREAQRSLVDDMKSLTAQYASLGSAFGGEGTSLSAQGLLAKKRDAAADAKEFRVDLGVIKRKGAGNELLSELRAEGPTEQGLALLRDLMRQPRSYFRQEDLAQRRVDQTARSLSLSGMPGRGATQQIGQQTNIGRQAVVNINGGVHWGPRERDLRRGIRKTAEHALLIAGS